jgi:hypothetical protein
MGFSRGFHSGRLVWAPVVIKLDPVGDDPHCMLLGLEAVTMHTLFFQGPDDVFDQAVLLRTMRRDELLIEPIAPDRAGVMATGEDQTVVGAQQERINQTSQGAKARDQRLIQGRGRTRGPRCQDSCRLFVTVPLGAER